MNAFLSLFRRRWFTSLLGTLAIAFVIWFLGPLLAFPGYEPFGPEFHRWIAISGLLLTWLVIHVVNVIKAKNENAATIASVAASAQSEPNPDEETSQDELRILNDRFHEALAILKRARLGSRTSGSKLLYELPWYILIGAPGSGKSTLLMNSRLRFPLAERLGHEAIQGVGGTRNCDWWFAKEAVLIDTAGRFTTQDSHEEADRATWLGFLDLLRQHRRCRPINGAIIAVSIVDLMHQNAEQRQSHARAIRKRLLELHERFGMQFPVYLLFTKLDLMSGFMEFFGDLDRDENDQVWGVTFPLTEKMDSNPVADLDQELLTLEERLYAQVIDKLELERGLKRRELIYKFPQQFSSQKTAIKDFTNQIFSLTHGDEPIGLRGVYFTSATQEGTPIDRIMLSVGRTFGLDRQMLTEFSGQGGSFFVNKLLNRVIFAEAGLAGANLTLERKRVWIQRGVFAAVGTVVALAVLLWSTSFLRNKSFVDHLSAKTQELSASIDNIDPNDKDPIALLPALGAARQLPGGFSAQVDEHVPVTMRFGLFQGEKLGHAGNAAYRRLLTDALLPRLMIRLEKRIENSADNVESAYEALKTYLMLGDAQHYDGAMLETRIDLDLEDNLPTNVSDQQQAALKQHLATLLAERPAPLARPLDDKLIRGARESLARVSLADRVYGRLKQEVAGHRAPDFRISQKAGQNAPMVLVRRSGKPLNTGIDGLYTCVGYQNIFLEYSNRLTEQIVAENWVMGKSAPRKFSETDLKKLRKGVLQLYVSDFIDEWEKLLLDLQIKPFASLEQVVEMLSILSDERSPIRLFLAAADKETRLNCLADKQKTSEGKPNGKLDSYKTSSDTVQRRTLALPHANGGGNLVYKIPDHFGTLHELVNAKDSAPTPLDASLELLNELYVNLSSLQHASGKELVLEWRKQAHNVIAKLKLNAKRSAFPVNRIIENIASGSADLLQGGVKRRLNSMWKSDVLDFCRKTIEDRYPIRPSASHEIAFADFTRFFAPGGLMDGFFTKYLADSVEKSGKFWRWNNQGLSSAAISPPVLRQFQRADAIKAMFFGTDRQSPTLSFFLKPISMDETIHQFNMNIDGQTLAYAHSPVRPTPIKWPGPDNSGYVNIQLLPPLGTSSGLTEVGPWALLRLLDTAKLNHSARPKDIFATFSLQGREAKFELSARGTVNPFHFDDMHRFRCPRTLI